VESDTSATFTIVAPGHDIDHRTPRRSEESWISIYQNRTLIEEMVSHLLERYGEKIVSSIISTYALIRCATGRGVQK
jgi:predicted transposase YdaD